MLLLAIYEAFFSYVSLKNRWNEKETASNKCNGDKLFFVIFAIRLSSMEFVEDLKYNIQSYCILCKDMSTREIKKKKNWLWK